MDTLPLWSRSLSANEREQIDGSGAHARRRDERTHSLRLPPVALAGEKGGLTLGHRSICPIVLIVLSWEANGCEQEEEEEEGAPRA